MARIKRNRTQIGTLPVEPQLEIENPGDQTLAHQRPSRPRRDGNAEARGGDGDRRISRGAVAFQMARPGRYGKQIQRRMPRGDENSERVVVARIAIMDDGLLHTASRSNFAGCALTTARRRAKTRPRIAAR